MADLSTTDPRVQAAARQLEMTMILRAWVEDGVLFIQNPYGTAEVPYQTKTDTLPRGSTAPASTSPGGSPGPSGPEPPSEDTIGSGLDDFTAIDGVGPTYAQALHNAGLYTYDDLREWPEILDDLLPEHTRVKMAHWLDHHLL